MASPQPSGGTGRLIGMALVAVVVFIVGFVARPVLVPAPSPALDTRIGNELEPIQSEVQALSERFDELQSSIDEQRSMLESQQETLAGLRSSRNENMSQLTEQFNALSTQFEELQSTVEDVRDLAQQSEDSDSSDTSSSSGQQQPDPASVTPDDDPALGDPDAPVTIIEFSDFQCPYCRQFEQQAFPQIKSEYIDTGKVRLVFRDFPLTQIHPNALPAAIAAECAHNQDAFWPMHNRLFANQSEWGQSSNPNEVFVGYATEIGLDMEPFRQCVENRETLPEISGDFQDGVDGGVRGTPAFFIGGEMLSGAQPFSAFQQRIEALLNSDDDAPSE